MEHGHNISYYSYSIYSNISVYAKQVNAFSQVDLNHL